MKAFQPTDERPSRPRRGHYTDVAKVDLWIGASALSKLNNQSAISHDLYANNASPTMRFIQTWRRQRSREARDRGHAPRTVSRRAFGYSNSRRTLRSPCRVRATSSLSWRDAGP